MRKICHLLILCLVIFSSCSKDGSVIQYFNIQDDFHIEASQMLTPDGGVPSLRLVTTKNQGCSNYEFNYTLAKQGSDFKLSINGLKLNGDICNEKQDIVSQNIPFNLTDTLSTVSIALIQNNELYYQGTLLFKNGYLNLMTDRRFAGRFESSEVNLVQKQTFWGQYWIEGNAGDAQLMALNKTIGEIVSSSEILKPGDYSYFKIGEFSTHVKFDQSTIDNRKSFVVKNQSIGLGKLQTLLSGYPQVKYKLQSFDGTIVSN